MNTPDNFNHNPERFLRLKEVCSRLGLSKSSIYKYMKDGTFPKPLKLGTRTSVWANSQIEGFMHNIMAGGTA